MSKPLLELSGNKQGECADVNTGVKESEVVVVVVVLHLLWGSRRGRRQREVVDAEDEA